jgi:hypothetical protein
MGDLAPRALAEGLGTGSLVAVVRGSGIAADRLSDDVALALLCNAVATAGGLVALLLHTTNQLHDSADAYAEDAPGLGWCTKVAGAHMSRPAR